MCTYEDLVAATLPYGLSPLVVPQLKTITLGGAVTGLGIESASFRNGLPHESVLEMDILTGAGDVVTASPDQHADLFRAFPNSYGTLGYSVRLQDRAGTGQAVRRAAAPAVSTRWTTWSRRWTGSSRPAAYDGAPVDYLDGVVFSADESYLCARHADRRPPARSATTPVSRSTTAPSSTRAATKHDRLTIHDYLWRWDTDWFWCSRAFGAQNPRIRRFWPRRYRRSSFYWKLIGYDQRFNIADRIEKRNGRPPRERVVQDVEVPIERDRRVPGLVPGRTCRSSRSGCARCGYATATATGRCIRSGPDHTYVNVGFWSSVPVGPEPMGTPTA